MWANLRKSASHRRFLTFSQNTWSGGGGSRTRVHEWVFRSFYVRISLRDLTAEGSASNPFGASRLNVSPSSGRRRGEASPTYRRLKPRLGRAKSGDGPALFTQPVPVRCWQLCFLGVINEAPEILSTLLKVHQTRRSRFAPFSLMFPVLSGFLQIYKNASQT